MLAAPLQNPESDGNANRGVLERLGKQALRGFESVHQRVAMGVQQPRGTRCIALLADKGQQGVLQSRGGLLEVAERVLDEFIRTVRVLGEQGNHLDVAEEGNLLG